MKKISLVLAACMLIATGNLFANDPAPNDPTESLKLEIESLLGSNNFKVKKDITAKVEFTLNQDQEIVVLEIDSKDALVKRYLKSRLDNRKVNLENIKEGEKFVVPVRLIAAKWWMAGKSTTRN